jgi:mycobactin lysine-N-oxygenase
MHNKKTLAVVGAGPKGIAVAVKAKVLEEFGLPVDRVVLIERHSVGAHWSGEAGYTNGEMKLGTSPDKDVVFPLETAVSDPQLSKKIRQRLMDFTWNSFLVETHRFSDWIDRGRPAPSHALWSCYLKWVSENLGPQVQIVKAEVAQIEINQGQWQLKLQNSTGEFSMLADRLMLTGPGKTRLDLNNGELPTNAYDLESFWGALKAKSFEAKGRLAVVGTGENAASVLLALAKYRGDLDIDVISPKGFISTRAENFYENQFYSQPDRNRWKNLAIADRIDFIERTDLGVFSTHAMQILNGEEQHGVIPGRMVDLKAEDKKLLLTVEYAGRAQMLEYDHVVLATGFDQLKTIKSFFSPATIKKLSVMLGAPVTQTELTVRIQDDLSVRGITPALHLPMLAGLMQGPGFSNLSCLGRLSDRIVLGSQVEKQQPQEQPTEVAS